MDDAKLSSIKYYFSDSDYYCPTMDLTRRTKYTDIKKSKENEALETLISYEEGVHRVNLITTFARLSMSWIEMLSNFEFERFLDGVRRLSVKNDQFELLVPLKLNLKRLDMPPDLKLRLQDIILAQEILLRYGKIYEPILEPFSFMVLKLVARYMDLNTTNNTHRKVLKTLLSAKLRKNPYFPTFYLKVRKALLNLRFPDIKEVNACFFNHINGSESPPLTLYEALKIFNKRNISLIQQRLERVLNKLSKAPILKDEEAFREFMNKNDVSYLSPYEFNKLYKNYIFYSQTLSSLTNKPWLDSLVFAPYVAHAKYASRDFINEKYLELAHAKSIDQLNELKEVMLLGYHTFGVPLLIFSFSPRKDKLPLLDVYSNAALTKKDGENIFSAAIFTFLKNAMISGTQSLYVFQRYFRVRSGQFLEGIRVSKSFSI